MPAMNSIALAIEVTTRAREHSATELARIVQAATAAQGQLDQLELYAADTASRWGNSVDKPITTELMRHHYQFLDRLHHAISLQHNVLESLGIQVDVAKNALLQIEFRLAGLKQVSAKKRHALNALETRREQRQMDELAAGQHSRQVKQRQTGGHT